MARSRRCVPPDRPTLSGLTAVARGWTSCYVLHPMMNNGRPSKVLYNGRKRSAL